MSCAVFAFEEDQAPARRLADQLGVALHPVHLHRFPDGEALASVASGFETALLYRGLSDPDPKLFSLLLAADALRRAGGERIVLVAPYLPYLRQDQVFEPGQPISRDVLGGVLGPAFSRIVTVTPHLHRTGDLTEVFGGTPVSVLSAAPLLAHSLASGPPPIVVGPDVESGSLTQAVAQALGCEALVLEKTRLGDEDVRLVAPAAPSVSGRRVALVDDVCSSGGTLIAAAEALKARGAKSVQAAVAHALFDAAAGQRLRQAGITRIASTDSCRHPTNRIFLAGLLADALREELVG